MALRVETVLSVDGTRIHRFQVVRERRVGDGTATGPGGVGDVEEWIVVGLERAEGDGSEAEVRLADPDFEWTRSVSVEAFRSGKFEPLVAGGVPVWGY